MKNLSIAVRLYISILFFLLPLATLLYFYTGEIGKQIDFAAQEKLGTAYLRPTVKALHLTQDHFTTKLRIDAGDREAVAQLHTLTEELNKTFSTLRDVNKHIGPALQFTDQGLKSRSRGNLAYDLVSARWQEIAATDSRATTREQYNGLIADLRGMIGHAGDTSNLILDPDLDSYYLMDTVLLALPAGIARIGDSVRHSYVAHNGGTITAESAKIETFASMIEQDDLARVNGNMGTTFNEDPNFYGTSGTLKPNTEGKQGEYTTAVTAYVDSLHKQAGGSDIRIDALLEQAAAGGNASYDFWVAAVDELDVLLQTRIDHFTGERNNVMIMFTLAVILAFGFNYFVTKGIRAPLKRLQTAMIEIADGKLDYPVPCLDQKDEIGDMARTLELFKETSIEASKMEKDQKKEQESKLTRQKHVDDLIQHFDKKVSTLLFEVSHAADSMQGAIGSMETTSRKTSDKSTATMAVTKETSSNVSAVAAAAEELSAAINEISRQVTRSATVTQDAVHKTQDADVTVKQLANAAQRIGEVVTLISGIAEQIDLLALNATIESARAGDAGKGFAVVATEVKNLASQTSKATETIAAQIMEVQKVVGNVVTSLDKIRGTIDEVNGIASTIAAAVEEQGAATKEIAMNIQRTSDRVQEVSSNVTEVGSMAVETNNNAKNVIESVNTFTGQSKTLQQEIEGFLGSIAKA